MSQPSSEPAAKPDQGKKDGDDLITLLDTSQRKDLTVLIASCTEGMRKLLLDNFNAAAGLNSDLLQENLTEDEKMMRADPNVDVSEYDNEKKLKAEAEKDLATSKMKNLKKDVLKAYDSWRETVLMRIGEALKDQETAKTQLKRRFSSTDPKPQAPHTSGTISDNSGGKSTLKLKDLFPPTKTPLTKLPMNKRSLVLHSIMLLLISLEHYNAWSRVLMLNLTSSFKLPAKTFDQEEYVLAKGLLESAKELTATEEAKKKQVEGKESRKWKVGIATAAGAAVIGVAGGLAAPLVATGVGSVMGGLGLGATAAAGYLGSVAGSTLLVGSLFGAYGGRMTGQMMDKYAREVEDFEFLPVHSSQKTSEDQKEGAEQASDHDHKLRVTICISGWLTEKEEVVKPWRVLGIAAEVFALKWELETLLNLGHAMDGMLTSAAWGYAQKQLVGQTIFAELMAAMWPIGLLKVARVLDNPFSVAKSQADKAGEVLADALINKAQGERPVTLIGYSLGARVIYTCLMSLAQRKAFGLIENAVIIGAPTPSDTSDWRILRSAVSGRLINVYSQNDYLLGFMYRTSALQYGVAGLQPVQGLAGVENVDVSEDVDGHTRYRFLVGAILNKIGFEDIDMAAVQEERQALVKMLAKEKKESLQAQRNRLLRRESYKEKPSEEEEAEHEASEMEKNVHEAAQKSLMARVLEWWYAPKRDASEAEKVAKNLQKGIQNPSDLKAAVGDTVEDVRASTQTYTQYVVSKLPSMPSRSPTAAKSVPDPSKAAKEVTKQAGTATEATKGYVAQAQGYLPSRSSLPSLPFGKSSKKPEPESSQPAKVGKKAVEVGSETAKTTGTVASRMVTEVVKPTVDNTLNPKDNPAVKAAKGTAKKTPIIHQASERIPGANKAADVTSSTVGTTVQNTTGTVSNLLNSTASKGGAAASSAGATAKDAASGVVEKAPSSVKAATPKKEAKDTKSKTEEQTYISRAAGYVPSMPSIPSWGSGRKKAPKLEKRDSAVKSPPATPSKPEIQKTASGVKSPPPKLGSRTESGNVKSPPPKLDRTPSGLKSPPADLEKLPAPLKSPSAKLERLPSGVRSPPAKLEKLPSGLKSPVASSTKKLTEAPQQVMKTGGDVAGKAAGTGQDAVKQGGGYLSSAGSAVTGKLPGFGRS
jgi:Protein of unknown function (DUF726)